MKWYFLFLFIIFSSTVFSQKKELKLAGKYLKKNKIEEAKSAIDKASIHEKTKQNPKTWILKGNIYKKVWENTENKKISNLEESFEAYDKALRMDISNKERKNIHKNIKVLSSYFLNIGKENFKIKKYKVALNAAENSLKIGEVLNSVIDSTSLRLAAQSAYFLDKNKTAQKYGNELIIINGIPSDYLLLTNIYTSKKDTLKAIDCLKLGLNKHKANEVLSGKLLEIYIENRSYGKAKQTLRNLEKTQPNNKTVYFAKGLVLTKEGNLEAANKAYRKAIEINPEYFEAYYNLGSLYYNQGIETLKKAENIPPQQLQKYEQTKSLAYKQMKQAMPFFETAHKLSAEDQEAIYILMIIYAKTQQYSKYKEMKLKYKPEEEEE